MIYTGIGSRETPKEILSEFENIGVILAIKGYTLRSGGADGADLAFEKGCIDAEGNKEIYLPWENFNNNKSKRFKVHKEAFHLAKKYRKNFDNFSISSRKSLARDCYQILGYDLNTPSDFVVCYTKDGKIIGGTSLAMQIAKDRNISVYNFGNSKDKEKFYEFLENI